MASEFFRAVYRFNKEVVGVEAPTPPSYLDEATTTWLHDALGEEACELLDARALVDQLDALGDSMIFALGGMYRAGLTPDQAEAVLMAIMGANFAKKAGTKESRAVEGVKDAVKPAGWVGPEPRIRAILEAGPAQDHECMAVQASDQMLCSCGLVWDVNDPEPPTCPKFLSKRGGV